MPKDKKNQRAETSGSSAPRITQNTDVARREPVGRQGLLSGRKLAYRQR